MQIMRSSARHRVFTRAPSPRAQLRLFCLPYAGGGASTFRAWSAAMEPAIDVCPVQLPGREARRSENPFTSLDPLIDYLAEELLPYFDVPFALFGHSMGALISFELARHIRRRAAIAPVHLFASAHRAPHVSRGRRQWHALPDEQLLDELRRLQGTPESILSHSEVMQLTLPVLRADLALCETYSYRPDRPLTCPISAFGGLLDTTIRLCDLTGWQSHTRATFRLHVFSGDHFFLRPAQADVLDVIRGELGRHVGSDQAVR